jgi:hypothetical protein
MLDRLVDAVRHEPSNSVGQETAEVLTVTEVVELLDETRRQLAARTVLQDTFRDLQDPADADLSDQDNDQGDFDEQER